MAQWRNSVCSFGIISQALHAVTAPLVFAQLALGLHGAALPVSTARLQRLGAEVKAEFRATLAGAP